VKSYRKIITMSISGYAIVFMFLVAVMFIGTGLYSKNSIESARAGMLDSNRVSARNEISNAIVLLEASLRRLESSLVEWDELFQQIDHPEYYGYWREHRMLNTDFLPPLVESAELFDRDGKVLARFNNSRFDAQIDDTNLKPRIGLESGRLVMRSFLKVFRTRSPLEEAKGYLGIIQPFLPTLNEFSRFNYVNADSLSLGLAEGESIRLDEVMQRIEFDIRTSAEAESMLEIVRNSVLQLASVIALLCLLFYLLMTYLFSKPLWRISQYVDRLRYSDPGSLEQDIHSLLQVTELEKVRESLNKYHSDLAAAKDNLDRKNRELWKLAHHDALTGMMNRRAFELEFKKSSDLLMYHRVGLGLILFDLNHFKAINDSYGHQVGDEVLKAVSQCIQKSLRKNENLYRLGGDEFAAIIIGSDSADAVMVAQRCMDLINEYDFKNLGILESVRVSCGIAHCQAHELDRLESLQWQADVAVYQAKRPGVNRPVLFSDDMADGSESVFSSWINNAVYEAVVNLAGIEMHYQPIVSNANGEIVYYESLLRIRHDGDIVPPASIFPVVALRHLETEMDQAVIQCITRDLRDGLIPRHTGVAINLSAESLSREDLIEWLHPLKPFLKDYSLLLEITETSLITRMGTAADTLESLRKSGFKVALDDFGSGYSSLRYLTGMPVDTIKFDISLIQGMQEPRLHKMVNDLSAMLAELNFDLVAEGIETRDLLDKVVAAGFNYSQGFYFGKPQRGPEVSIRPRQRSGSLG